MVTVRWGLVVGALVALASGCHKQSADYDAWDHLLEDLGPDQLGNVDIAKQMFTLAIAPMPGVATPSGKRRVIPCATLAVDLIRRHDNELTDEERAIVDGALSPAPHPLHRTFGLQPKDLVAADPQYVTWVKEAAKKIETESGASAPKIDVYESTTLHPEHPADGAAAADGLDASGDHVGPIVQCNVVLYPPFAGLGESEKQETIAHETFHCYLDKMFSSLEQKQGAKGWLKEGSAEWAAGAILNHAHTSASAWQSYLETPQTTLTERKYSAVGFFAQLKYEGLTPWLRMSDIVTGYLSGGDEGAIKVATTGSPDFFAHWATSFLRDESLGYAWTIDGVDIPTTTVFLQTIELNDEFSLENRVAPLANDFFQLNITAETVQLRVPTGSRLRRLGSGTEDITAPSGDWCTKPDGCSCPDDSAHAGEVTPFLAKGSYYLTVPGRYGGSPWLIAGSKNSRRCERSPIDPCLIGAWKLNTSSSIDPTGPCKWITPIGASLSISATGVYTFDITPIGTIDCAGSQRLRFFGTANGIFDYADHGYAGGTNDLSGLAIETFLGGTSAGVTAFSSFAPDLVVGSGTTTYQCTSSELRLTNDSTTNTYVRP